MINGETTVELDFKALHPTILFAQVGRKLDFDPYLVPGYPEVPRDMGKRTFLRLMDKTLKGAGRAILDYEQDDQGNFRNREHFRAYVCAMRRQLHPVRHLLGKGCALRLQKIDSDMAIDVIDQCLRAGICVYPVHDSFIVKESEEHSLREFMEFSSVRCVGLKCEIE